MSTELMTGTTGPVGTKKNDPRNRFDLQTSQRALKPVPFFDTLFLLFLNSLLTTL